MSSGSGTDLWVHNRGEVTPANGQIEVESGQGVSVVYVHPQSPAASAGVMPRDRLIRINERAVVGMSAEEVLQLIRRMTVARIQPLQLEVVREGLRRTLSLMAVPACKFSIQLVESDQINGIADGRHIGSEDELAWVVAHEIAHNVLNHSQNARLGVMLNTFLSATTGVPGALAGTMPSRRSLEARADYVGAYIMARAGYDVRAIKQFLRRMERLRSGDNTGEMDRDHPTTVERLAAFEETLKEIEDKRQRGEPLEPVSAEP